MAESLAFVNENDEPIGVGDRQQAWTNGYYTRNIRVVLRDENGRFLSQKRSSKKTTFAGMWTVAASGHVDEGETWDEAARRETQEEIGVAVDLKLVGNFVFKNDEDGKKIRQIIHVYEAVIDSSTQFSLQQDEVEDIKWYKLEDLKSLMQATPNKFTPSFRETVARFFN